METTLQFKDKYTLVKTAQGNLFLKCDENYEKRYAEIFLTPDEVEKLISDLTILFPAKDV